jgi:hypothetical protein
MEGVMKLKYEHDTERWLRSQAKIYALRQNLGMAATFERCADDVRRLKEENAALKYSNDGFANFYHDMEIKHRSLTEELAALKAAAGPVAKWWYCDRRELIDRRNVICAVDAAKLDELARLCGEEEE